MSVIEIVVSILVQAAEPAPVTAECTVQDEISGRRLTRVWFDCPTDVEDAADLQNYADRVAGQLELPINLRRLRPSDVNREVTFQRIEQGWVLPEPVWFILSTADIDRSGRGPVTEAVCATRYTIAPSGTAEDMETSCTAFVYSDDTPHSAEIFVESVAESFERWRWFTPAGGVDTCRVTQTTHTVAREDYHRPWLDDPHRPRAVYSATVEAAPECP